MVLKDEDPTVAMLRSGQGRQVQSARQTFPAWGFGTAGRDASAKLYLSKEQERARGGNNSPGPVYKSFAAIGPQPESIFQSSPAPGFGSSSRSENHATSVPGPGAYSTDNATSNDSRKGSSPKVVFGTASRDYHASLPDELMRVVAAGRASPGPCTYTIPGSCGKQVDSRYSSQPSYRAASARRFQEINTRKDNPGAGAYEATVNSFGKQFLSNRASLPSAKIGTSRRDDAKKVFISKEHEKSCYGEIGPGPATGVHVPACAPQKSSVKKSYPAWGFGTSARSKSYSNDVPGPGSYWA